MDGTATWLTAAFGLADPATLSPGRHGAAPSAGRVWRLDTPSGAYAAKELFRPPPATPALAVEVGLTRQCIAAGVPAPEPVLTADGDVAVQHPSTRRSWRLHRWVDGEVPPFDDVPCSLWLCRQLALIHRLGVPAPQDVHAFYRRVDVRWSNLAEEALEQGFGWAPALARRAPELADLSQLPNAAPSQDLVLSHGDAHPPNTLHTAAGSRYLLDWDNAGATVPGREVGVLLLPHLRNGPVLRGLVAAYRTAGGPGDVTGPHTFSTALARELNALAERVQLALGAPPAARPVASVTRQTEALQRDEHPERASAAIGELIGRLPTPAMVAGALRVLTRV